MQEEQIFSPKSFFPGRCFLKLVVIKASIITSSIFKMEISRWNPKNLKKSRGNKYIYIMEELNRNEQISINGGNVPTGFYMDNDVIKANKNVFDFFVGIFVGFFN